MVVKKAVAKIHFLFYKNKDMGQKIIKGLQNPIISRVAGISIGAVISFSMVLGAYKESFDTMKEDVEFTKNSVQQIKIDVAVLKTKQEEIYKK